MQDLKDMAAKLLETARNLPPGPERHALLKQIGTFRTKVDAIAAKRERLQSAKAKSALTARGMRETAPVLSIAGAAVVLPVPGGIAESSQPTPEQPKGS